MAAVRWLLVVALAGAIGLGGMAIAAAQLRPAPEPCLDNMNIQPEAHPMCVAPETPSTIVFGVGAAGATVVVVGFLLYRRSERRLRHR